MLPVTLHSVKTGGEESAQYIKPKIEVSKVGDFCSQREEEKKARQGINYINGKKKTAGLKQREVTNSEQYFSNSYWTGSWRRAK